MFIYTLEDIISIIFLIILAICLVVILFLNFLARMIEKFSDWRNKRYNDRTKRKE